jgi:hypothetical protein
MLTRTLLRRTLQLCCLLAASAAAVELTEANWDAQLAGKVAFLKFYAPWCPRPPCPPARISPSLCSPGQVRPLQGDEAGLAEPRQDLRGRR